VLLPPPKPTRDTHEQIRETEQRLDRDQTDEKSGRGVRELLEGVDGGMDLGDDDGEALEHHRRHELPVAPFLRRRGGRGAEASRPPERPEEKARHRRRSGVGGGPGSGGRAATVVCES